MTYTAEEIIQAWKDAELTGDSAMILISSIITPKVLDADDRKWAKQEIENLKQKNRGKK